MVICAKLCSLIHNLRDFNGCLDKEKRLIEFAGLGHTAVIYADSTATKHIAKFREELKVCRVLVNTPASQGAIGDLYNFRLDPSLTLGCGTWGGSAVSENGKAKCDKELKTVITAAFAQNRAVYGTRRLKKALEKQGYRASRRRIGRIMQEAQLVCKTKRRFRATTNSKHDLPIAPNQLARQFEVNQANQVYVGDITYIHTQEGWLYLAVVIDFYSRLAWAGLWQNV